MNENSTRALDVLKSIGIWKTYIDKYKYQLKLTLLENIWKFTEAKRLIKMPGIEFVK